MRTIQRWSVQLTAIVILVALGSQNAFADDSWPQWGGVSRDFSVSSAKLADKWPADGPPKLWSRPLGDGYSSIVSDGELLFTMYRNGHTTEREIIVALDASSGKTVWEHEYDSKLREEVSEWGHGPNSTPLLSGDRLYAIGTNAVLHCLDKATGKVLWKRDMVVELSSPPIEGFGYSSSPLVYKDTLIVALGTEREKKPDVDESMAGPAPAPPPTGDGRNRGVVALSLTDGSKIWESKPYVVNASSPLVITHGGQDQLVLLIEAGIAAIDPTNGAELWSMSFKQPGDHIVSPVWDGVDLLLAVSSQDSSGGRAIRLSREQGKTVPSEVWYSRKVRAVFGNPVRDRNNIYAPGSSRLVGADLQTGERYWSKGGFESTSCVLADGKLIILDENGKLTLATPSAKDLVIHSQVQVTEKYSITCPTLVGDKLFIRDRKNILALDVGVGGGKRP